MNNLKKGQRVRIVGHHPWMANRYGAIKEVTNAPGNRFLVKFDEDELRTWHDTDGDPVLFLGERDLVAVESSESLAA